MVKHIKSKHHLPEEEAVPKHIPAILNSGARPTRAGNRNRRDLIAEADRIRAMTAGPLEDSVALLRRDRDS